ncbi:MAG: MBL fold metallo-hydrolase [Bauldia sp.]
MKSYLVTSAAALAVVAGAGLASAQAPRPTVESLMAAAKVAAGTEWGNMVMATCIAPAAAAPAVAPATVAAAPAATPAAPTLPPKDAWWAPPAKVADNFYFLGTKAHSAWALVASNGEMIIIDNLFDYAAPDEIIGGLKRLGLDPNKAKYNVVAHAHGDHDGGVPYIQQNIPGIKIIYGAGDWPAVDARTGAAKVRHDPDADGTDGRVLTVGDVSLKMVTMPGHTPGTLSFLFEIKDGGQVKKVAYSGGTLFSFTEKAEFYDQYVASSRKFAQAAAEFGATILITNHTQYDLAYFKAHTAQDRKPGDPNPFENGAQVVGNYFTALQNCALAAKLRATGTP